MARFARVVMADVAHHVTQHGNARQVILCSDSDRAAYLESLRHYADFRPCCAGLLPDVESCALDCGAPASEALAQISEHTHGRYTSYWNARNVPAACMARSLLLCPLNEAHL